jgi:preprotein translocase subunit Sss1
VLQLLRQLPLRQQLLRQRVEYHQFLKLHKKLLRLLRKPHRHPLRK